MSYKTAANLALFARNDEAHVAKCLEILEVNPEDSFVFKPNPEYSKKGSLKHPFPTPITFREAISQFVDLTGPLRKKTVKDLSQYSKNEEEKKE